MGIKHSVIVTTGQKGQASDWNADHIFDSDADVAGFQLLTARIENRTTWPAGPAAGQIIFRTDLAEAYVWDGVGWVVVSRDRRGATMIVAASNSDDLLHADFVCDGVADEVEIQDAIDALPATGGRVLLLDGTYNITVAALSNSITINKPNVTLQGQGRNTVLAWANAAIIFAAVIKVAGMDDVVISDLKFSVTGAGLVFFLRVDNGSDNLEVRNITGSGPEVWVYAAATCDYMRFFNWTTGAMTTTIDVNAGARCEYSEMRGTALSFYVDGALTKSIIAGNNVFRISTNAASSYNLLHGNITNILVVGGATNVSADNQTGW